MLRFTVFLSLLLGGSGALAEQAIDARDNDSHWYLQGGAYFHLDNRDDY